MDNPVQIAIYAILALAALWLVISAAGALPLFMLAKVNLTRLEPNEARPWLQKVIGRGIVEPQWLSDNAFEPRGVYHAAGQVGNPHFVIWQKTGQRSYICVYIVMENRVEIDLITMCDVGGLTTGSTKDGLTIPGRPFHWMQAFPIRDVAPLWKQHEAGLAFITQTTSQRPSTKQMDFIDEFVTNVRAHVAYVRTIPLWFLRIPYWYFFRRNRLYKRTVREQHERYGVAAASCDRPLADDIR
jgi:hypothetical protein